MMEGTQSEQELQVPKLKNYGVEYVIAVDDDFDSQISLESKISELPDNFEEDLEAAFADKREDYNDFIIWLQNVQNTDDVKISLYGDRAEGVVNNYNKYKEDLRTKLFEILSAEFKEHFYTIGAKNTVATLKETLNKLSSQNKEKYVLIILDKILGNENEWHINLSEVLKEINDQMKNEERNVLLIMHSSEPTEFTKYDDIKKYLQGELKLEEQVAESLSLHINFIDKSMGVDVDQDSVNLMNNLIKHTLRSQKGSLLRVFEESYRESEKYLREKIWFLENNQAMFYYNYLAEGQHVDDIIFNILTRKLESSTYQRFRDYHSKIINPIRKSMQHFAEEYSLEDSYLYLRFKNDLAQKIAMSNQSIALVDSSDISYGDIIKITSDKCGESYYMVVSQECDLTIRSDGKRLLDSLQLIRIQNEIESDNDSKTFLLLKYMLKFADKNRKKIHDILFSGENDNYIQRHDELVDYFITLGFDEVVVKKVLEYIRSNSEIKNYPKNINVLNICEGDIEESNRKMRTNSYGIGKDKTIISLDTIWLDALLLKPMEGLIVLSEDMINKSHEIRSPLKKHLIEHFKNMENILNPSNSSLEEQSKDVPSVSQERIDHIKSNPSNSSLEEQSKDVLSVSQERIDHIKSNPSNSSLEEQSKDVPSVSQERIDHIKSLLDFSLSKVNIQVTPRVDNSGKLELVIENVERIGRIDYLRARSMHNEVLQHQTRIGFDNGAPLV